MIDTKLADRTASLSAQAPSTEQPVPSLGLSQKSIRPGTPKDKSSPLPQETSSPSSFAQLRSELATTHKTRSDLEAKLSALNTELSSLKATDSEQKKRIAQLEKIKEQLERRMRDRADEIKGKGKLFDTVQDENLALHLELNMAEQEKEKLRKENEELTRRWVDKMEAEAKTMNERNDQRWKDGSKRK